MVFRLLFLLYLLYPLFDMPEAPFALPYRVEAIEEDVEAIEEDVEAMEEDEDAIEEDEDAVTPEETTSTSAARFEELNLSKELLKGLYVEMKFHRPNKIQSLSLPVISASPSKIVTAQAYNGSGKSTCFVMCMLSLVDSQLSGPQALCLCPNSELAAQNLELSSKIGKYTGITAELSIPNTADYVPIAKRSPVTSQVIIGTAGTVYKLIAGKKLPTYGLKIVMIDDADHMLIEGGLKEDSVRIMKDIFKKNPECKVLLCATIFNDHVKAFVDRIRGVLEAEQCIQFFVKKKDGPALNQYKVNVPDELSKINFIINKILEIGKFDKTIIFVQRKESALKLHEELLRADHLATNFHDARTPEEKDSFFESYRKGFTQHLITKDIHARGFDLEADLVINFDLPPTSGSTYHDCELYVHRSGRVGRRKRGTVFSLLCGPADDNLMEKIEKYNENTIRAVSSDITIEEFEGILGGH